MLDQITQVLSSLRSISPAVFLGLAIATGTVLFIDEGLAVTLGVENLRQEYRGHLGLGLLVSLSILASQSLWFVGEAIQEARKRRKKKRNLRKKRELDELQLHKLTPDEKAYLLPFIYGENTMYFKMEDGVAGGLEAKNIIYRSSNMGSLVRGWAYNLQPWAREYLEANSYLLEGANSSPNGPPDW